MRALRAVHRPSGPPSPPVSRRTVVTAAALLAGLAACAGQDPGPAARSSTTATDRTPSAPAPSPSTTTPTPTPTPTIDLAVDPAAVIARTSRPGRSPTSSGTR